MLKPVPARIARLGALIVTLIGLGIATPAQADFEAIRDYYVSRGNAFPPTALVAEDAGRDGEVFERLQIPAVLAVVKHELASKRLFPELSSSVRRSLLRIISDPALVFSYSGKQSVATHTTGCQTISETLVRCHQAGFFASGAPRSHHFLGQILLHEMGHIYQKRHLWFPDIWIFSSKETFPLDLERQLPSANFSPAIIAQVTALMKGQMDPPPDRTSSLECGPADALCIAGFECARPSGCYKDCICVARECASGGLPADCPAQTCTRWEWREVCD